MANIKEIKNRIGSVSFTRQITKAMKMVAASKLRRSQNTFSPVSLFYEKLKGTLKNIYPDIHNNINNYVEDRGSSKILFVVISSDRGLCGSFNSGVFKKTVNFINSSSNSHVSVLPIGNKAFKFFKNKKYNIINDYVDFFKNKNLNFESSNNISNYIVSNFLDLSYDKVIIVYNKFFNNVLQKPILDQILPISNYSLEGNKDYLYESNKQEVSDVFMSYYLKIHLYRNILDSIVSEHAARMIAMGKATDNATDLLKDLKITYNRTRQAAITKEMLEIVNGAEALSN